MGYVMISMAVYGAMVGTTSGGASVALNGVWVGAVNFVSPRSSGRYVAMKVLTSMTLGLLAVSARFTVGALNGVHMAGGNVAALGTWRLDLLAGFAAFVCSWFLSRRKT